MQKSKASCFSGMNFTLLFLASLFHLQFLLSDITASPLRVGMELSYPPFEMICEEGTPCGISVEMAYALGEYLNRPVIIENISYIGLIPALRNGNIDMIISSLTANKDRERAISFSIPYATIGLSLLISKKSDLKNIDEANASGRIIVVKAGTTGEAYALRHLPNATVRVLDKEATCVLEVVQGKADAFIYDQLSVYTNWQKNQDTTRANLTSFKQEEWAVGIKKDNQELIEQVNGFIQVFKQKGGFDALADKYLPKQKAAFKKLGIPFVF